VIVTDAVSDYLLESRPQPDALLLEMEAHGNRDGIPIVVPPTGALLSVLAAACGARRVVEVGTAIGVSTLYIARAMAPDGLIVSFEIDPVRQRAARAYLDRAGVGERADLRLRDAAEGLAELDREAWDMVFLDGLKGDYPAHLELAIPLLRSGGLVVVDNTMLSGLVAEGRGDVNWTQESIDTMRRFNAALLDRSDMVTALLPVGDGVLVGVRR
jgi:predicted O-methyltransferase YrrM